jgi:hypothetical protein
VTRRRGTALPNHDRTDEELEKSRITADNPTVITIAVPAISARAGGPSALKISGSLGDHIERRLLARSDPGSGQIAVEDTAKT